MVRLPNEVEDNFYLLGIPIPRFFVSIYILRMRTLKWTVCFQKKYTLSLYRKKNRNFFLILCVYLKIFLKTALSISSEKSMNIS